MNWLDIVILCLAGAGLIKGLYDGMIRQIVALIAIVVGVYLCSSVSVWVRGYLEQQDKLPQQFVTIASYAAGFILIAGVIMLAGYVAHRLVSATPLSIINHLVGGVLGLLLMALFISFTINIMEIFDTQSTIISRQVKVESRFYLPAKGIIPSLFPGKLFEF